MGFFGMLFWIAVFWLAYRWWRGPVRYVAVGPTAYAPEWPRRHRYRHAEPTRPDAQQEHIDALESRVSDLEERLDFTERLLASRRESA